MNHQLQPTPTRFDVRQWGAVGDGLTLDTHAIQRAIDVCGEEGGGTVLVPAGTYLTGALFLRSRVSLFLDAGATLLGSPHPEDYPPIMSRWEGLDQETHAPLIGGSELEQVAVLGRGTVDGGGAPWWERHRNDTLDYPRPRLIAFQDCTNLRIADITVINSPSWTITPLRCENVTIDGVTVLNPADSPKTDGINPDACRNVRIANCHIDVGDDCITIKSGVETGGREHLTACENITVTNCTMVHGHGGVVIGSEMSGDVRNVVIANCIFDGTDRGIRLKSRRGRGGLVEDIRVTNIVMRDVACPFTMNLYYAVGRWGDGAISDKLPHPVTEATPRMRRIHLSHISARGVTVAAGFVFGLPEMAVEDISLDDVRISLSPNGESDYPDMADDIPMMKQAGLYFRNASRVRLSQVEIRDQVGSAVTLIDCNHIDISSTTTPTPDPIAPVMQLDNIANAFVHGCSAEIGTPVFVHITGDRSDAIQLSGNHLGHANQPALISAEAQLNSSISIHEDSSL